MRALRIFLAKKQSGAESARVQTASATQGRAVARDPRLIRPWAPVAWGEGARVGVLGDSGCGKSHASRALVAEYLRVCGGVVWVADWAGHYPGQRYRDPVDMRAVPPASEPRVLCFSGDIKTGRPVSGEDVARSAWGFSVSARIHSLLVLDELSESCTNGQWRRGVERVPSAFTMGRKARVSVLWGAQFPQQVPQAAFDQSQILLIFRLSGAPLELLKRRGYLDARAAAVVSRLPGPERPPRERGEFVAIRRGQPWDGCTYRY